MSENQAGMSKDKALQLLFLGILVIGFAFRLYADYIIGNKTARHEFEYQDGNRKLQYAIWSEGAKGILF